MRPTIYVAAASLLLGTAMACTPTDITGSRKDETTTETPGQGIVAGTVRVTRASNALQLKNNTERPVHYFVFERNTVYVATWMPCTSTTPACPTVLQGETNSVPFTNILGYTNDATEAFVYWWQEHPDGSVSPVQSVLVRLRD